AEDGIRAFHVTGVQTCALPISECLSAGTLPCLIKALSLRDASLLINRGGLIPQVLESAVLDLQHDDSDVARLNGYVHAIAAAERSEERRAGTARRDRARQTRDK